VPEQPIIFKTIVMKDKDITPDIMQKGENDVMHINGKKTLAVTFKYLDKSLTVTLDNGHDVIKLGNIFSQFLNNNGIPNTITTE